MNDKAFIKFVNKQIKKSNLTKKDFADLIGVSRMTVYRWEIGSSLPDPFFRKHWVNHIKQILIDPDLLKK